MLIQKLKTNVCSKLLVLDQLLIAGKQLGVFNSKLGETDVL